MSIIDNQQNSKFIENLLTCMKIEQCPERMALSPLTFVIALF